MRGRTKVTVGSAVWRVFLCLVALTAIVSCFPSDPLQQGLLGVRSFNGQIEIRVRSCVEGATVTDIRVMEWNGKDGRVVWQVESSGSSEQVFVIGKAPAGFREVQTLERLRESQDYVVEVQFAPPALGLRIGLIPELLPHEQWKTTNVKQRLVSDADFDTEPIDCLQ